MKSKRNFNEKSSVINESLIGSDSDGAGDCTGECYVGNSERNCSVTKPQNGMKTSASINGYRQQASQQNGRISSKCEKESFEHGPFITAILTYLGFNILLIIGYISHLISQPKVAIERYRESYASLYNPFENFYLRYVYRRLKDISSRPVSSVPGAELIIKRRITHDNGWTYQLTGEEIRCLNLGSYNYLGFAASEGPCADDSVRAIETMGLALCSPRLELGTTAIHEQLEKLTAEFLGTEDAIVFGMGFATNALNLPSLLSPGCLVISDEKNHASIILGLRLSGATVRVFKHNNVNDLERILRNAVVTGQPRTGAAWKKILIVVEGVFSMEGSIVKLPEIVALKKKYKAYIYLDEAHSIGAMGANGRGVVDYYNLNPSDVDILMGTFTKSFGSSGGYIAGSKKLINFLRANSHAHCYAHTMSPPTVQQIITSMKTIMGHDGTPDGANRLRQLAKNSRYFRKGLERIGVITFGHVDSPVIPMLVYFYSKLSAVARILKDRNIAVVAVGFPATPILQCRIRFCMSAAHTKEQLDYALKVIAEISESLGLKYSRKRRDSDCIQY